MRPQRSAEVDLSHYSYPTDTPGANMAGFAFSLSSSQTIQLEQMRAWMEEREVSPDSLTGHSLHPDLTRLRYLRANKFDVELAGQHMLRNIAWREESAVNTLLELRAEEVLGCSMRDYQTYLPHWHCGYDKTGRPVIYKQYGSFENNLLSGMSTIEAVTKYHVWEQEAVSRICYRQSQRTGYIVETSFAILDLEGMQLRQVTKDFLAIVKAFANIDHYQAQYPESLGRLVIINAPAGFSYVWGWVKPWLDPVVVSKIQILGGPSSWQPVFFDLIGKEQMPENYGGDLPPLTKERHPYLGFEDGFKLEQCVAHEPLTMEALERRELCMHQQQRRASFRRAPSLGIYPDNVLSAFSSVSGDPTPQQHHRMQCGRPASNRLHLHMSCEADDDSRQLRYPESTPGRDSADGYVFSLTETQTLALKAIQQWMQEEQLDIQDLVSLALHPNLALLRYLRANKFDVEATIAQIRRNIAWRKEQDIEDINSKRPEEVLGCSMRDYQTYLPHWHCGYDKTGRPVIYKQYGSFENSLLQDHCSLEAVTKYHVWEQEAVSRICYRQSQRTGYIVETSFAIMDLEGMQLRQVTNDFLTIVKAFASIDQAQYPETLGRLLIINAPALFPMVWSGVKAFLDPVVTSKIQIYGKPSSWQPVLFDLIGKEQMPENYGGDLPRITPDSQPYPLLLETQSGYLRSVRLMSRSGSSADAADLEAGMLDEAGSVDSNAFYDAVEQQEVQDVFNIVSRQEGVMQRAASQLFVLQRLTSMSHARISQLFSWSLAMYLVMTFAAMVLSAYALHSVVWIEGASGSERWTTVIIVISSFFLFVVIFFGFIGGLYRNILLLEFFSGSVAASSLLYFIVSVGAFVYRSSKSGGELISRYRLVIGIGCLLLSLYSVLPLAVSRSLALKYKQEQDKRIKPQQLREIIRAINAVCGLCAVGMIMYGGFSLSFLRSVDVDISSTVYSVYGLVYCGNTIVISAFVGFWASVTTRRNVVAMYFGAFIPLIALLLIAAAVTSFVNLVYEASSYSEKDYHLGTYSKGYISSEISTELLLSGILFIFCCVFHLLSAVVSRRLWVKMDEDHASAPGGFKYSSSLTARKRTAARTWQESCLVAYGVLGGVYLIYFKGTFVVFGVFVRNNQRAYALNWLANPWFGGLDPRYAAADPYILSSDGCLALIVGPLMLLYAWATFVRAPFRHIVGVMVSTSFLYNSCVYYGIEIQHDFSDLAGHGRGVLAVLVIIDLLCSFALPCVILGYEGFTLNRNSSKVYSHSTLRPPRGLRVSLLRGPNILGRTALPAIRESADSSEAASPSAHSRSRGDSGQLQRRNSSEGRSRGNSSIKNSPMGMMLMRSRGPSVGEREGGSSRTEDIMHDGDDLTMTI